MEKLLRLRSGARAPLVLAGVLVVALALAAAGSSSAVAKGKTRHLKLVFLSFAATNNSYDAPMLAAAKAEASKLNASLQVMDANNSPTTQYSDFQTALTESGVKGIITQPIESTNLIPLVAAAVKKKIRVVNVDQVMGPKYTTAAVQVKGLSGNVSSTRGSSVRCGDSWSSRRVRPSTWIRATSGTCTTSSSQRWTWPFTRHSRMR